MLHETETVPREVIDQIVGQLERLRDDACDRWTVTKSNDPVRIASWRNREAAYRAALQLLADAGLAPPKYAARKP